MPLVFVHGVNVRMDERYRRETHQRNQNFAKILFPLLGREIQAEHILNPFWGDLATNSGSPFIPPDPQWMIAKLTQRLTSGSGSLLRLARRHPMKEVCDVMVAASMESQEDGHQFEEVSQLGLSLIKFSNQFDSLEEQNDWLGNISSDEEFLAKLDTELKRQGKQSSFKQRQLQHLHESAQWLKERYSLRREQAKTGLMKARERLQDDVALVRQRTKAHVKAVGRITRTAASEVSATALTQPMRRLFHDRMFFFIGDAFSYFGQRGTPEAPGPVIARVSQAVAEARSLVSAKDPELIVIAHSMGGNIVCDLVSHFERDKPIDLLITVGSQFPLFADLQMFPGLGTTKPFKKPDSVKRWVNIYDMNDVFAFAAQPLFENIEDHHYASGRIGTTTHADCFKFISLYEHMAQAVTRGINS
jgi:predicted alpha/beta hydrolase family esterase